MSSIRDALKRAEEERQRRLGEDTVEAKPSASDNNVAPEAPAEPEPPRVATPDVSRQSVAQPQPEPVEEPPQEPAPPAADLKVVESPRVYTLEVPSDFGDQLSLFRQGVESALPNPRRSLILTSATAGEGVTTLASFLAVSLAVRDGKRTVLVDANFRSAKTTRLFGLIGRTGLSDYCTGRVDLNGALQRTDSPDLYVMGSGTVADNPSMVLSSERARGLAAELTQRFDYVLMDAGAVLSHAETSMFSPFVDGVVFIVRAHRTKREVISKAEKLIRASGGRVIGTVLNRRKFHIPETIYKRL